LVHPARDVHKREKTPTPTHITLPHPLLTPTPAMPRDLNAIAKDQSAPDDMPELTKSPDDLSPKEASGRPATATIDAEDEDGMLEGSLFSQISQRNEKRDELHPYCQTLKPSDVESCTRLEEEAFPPHERATREKVSLYHLLLLCFARRRRTRWPPVTATPPLYCLALRALSSLFRSQPASTRKIVTSHM
jgi:hypothetical protein